jgi:uncharacterized membrane protein
MNNQTNVLIEPGTRYFLDKTLKECHKTKMNYLNILYNIGYLFLFLLIVSLFLYYQYYNKKSFEQKKHDEIEKDMYILQKIHQYQRDKQHFEERITNLPRW